MRIRAGLRHDLLLRVSGDNDIQCPAVGRLIVRISVILRSDGTRSWSQESGCAELQLGSPVD